jgi:hypothetical protein
MHRGGWRWSGRAAGIAIATALVLVTGCGTPSSVQVSPPVQPVPESASAGTDGSAAPESGQPTPEVGECRGPVDLQIIDAAADTRETVECGAGHGSETFWVGEMDPTIDTWPAGDEQAGDVLSLQVDEECSGRHLEYLGYDATAAPNLPPDRLQLFAYFIPTEADFADGARWFRCDALVEPLNAAETTSIEGTLEDVYGSPLPVSYRLCEGRLGLTVGCDDVHELEYLASVVLDDLTAYPSQRGDPRVTAACRTPLLDALGLTQERQDLVFGYLLPTEAAWNDGAQGATCVVGAADGSELSGTLAGLGPDADLPLA